VAASVVAIAAFLLSIFNTIQVEVRPKVAMTLPEVIRVEHYNNPSRVQIQIQTSFTIGRSSSRTAIVQRVKLSLAPPQGYVNRDPQAHLLFYGKPDSIGEIEYGQDVTPIVVTQDSPATPILVFELQDDQITTGTWGLKLTAAQIDSESLEESFCMALSPEAIAYLTRPGDITPTRTLFQGFTTTINDKPVTTTGLDTSCYVG
jgi:hypothetical protein